MLEAVQGSRATLGDTHPYTLRCVNDFGELLFEAGRLAEVEMLLRQVLQCSSIQDHPEAFTIMLNLARVLEGQSKHREALSLYRRAHNGQCAVLGVGHPDTIMTASCLARVLEKEGKAKEPPRRPRSSDARCAGHGPVLDLKEALDLLLQEDRLLDAGELLQHHPTGA